MPKIFISYRRQDSNHQAGRLYDHLSAHFGPDQLFKDVDSIELGQDFRRVLAEKVGECDVLLALVGDGWLSAASTAGQRRLDDPTDYVRIEIESALRREIPVIPLLVGQAPVPPPDSLPPSLQDLAYRHGMHIRPDPDFRDDVQRLVRHLSKMTCASAREPEPRATRAPDPPPVQRPERHEDPRAGRQGIKLDWMLILRLLVLPGLIANIVFVVRTAPGGLYVGLLFLFTLPAAALLWGHFICVRALKNNLNRFFRYWGLLTLNSVIIVISVSNTISLADSFYRNIKYDTNDFIIVSAGGLVFGFIVGSLGALGRYVLQKLILPKAPAAAVRKT
jgi:hypothetical protein